MNLVAWLVVGAIASDIAALIAMSEGARHRLRSLVLGTAAALVAGFLAGLVIGMKDPVQGVLEPAAIVVAGLAAVLAVIAQTAWSRRVA
jgi:uncharacterized membrane protein YeaQ/YmgE (transglycosylase-associated protein family)